MIRRWDKAGVPHKGWRCIRASDLRFEHGDYYEPQVCQMCGNERLRFVHLMRHDDYPSDLLVGCVCASKMEGNSAAPRSANER